MPPKAVAKGSLKAKGTATCKPKAAAKGKPGGKALAKSAPEPVSKANRGGAKGWDEIQPGKATLGKLGAMAVMDQLKHLKKNGNSQAMEHYKGLKGQAKVEFALSLKVDREASFMTVQENHSLEISNTNSYVSGWLSEAQVAQEMGLINYTTCTIQAQQLKDILEGMPSMPHERPDLAAKGYKLYQYNAKKLSQQTQKTKDTLKTECVAKVESAKDHDGLVEMFHDTAAAQGGFQAAPKTHSYTYTWSTSSITLVGVLGCGVMRLLWLVSFAHTNTHVYTYTCHATQVPKKLPKPNTTPKEISDEEKAKLDWVKEIKSLSHTIQKDTNLFLSWKFKGSSLLGDKQSGVTKELMMAIENGIKQLQAQGEAVSEVLVLGSSMDYKAFNPKTYAKAVAGAQAVLKSLGELKSRGIRIIGKR
jgi:hypothetical protein